MLKHLKFYACDRCGKQISTDEVKMHVNRIVGLDGDLMIHLSKTVPGTWKEKRQETMCLCPQCWARVFRAVRRALRLEEKAEAGK
jgi:DNA-directed RNA polymerase subunit RPC12/RpoP